MAQKKHSKTNSIDDSFKLNYNVDKNKEIFTISLSHINEKNFKSKQETNENNNTNNEIFKEQEEIEKNYNSTFDESVSWLKANFFLTDQRLLFGTWDGVFSSIVMSLFGVVMFVRAGWMVANAGILVSLLIILICFLTALISLSSAISLCQKCKLNHESNLNGGVFYLLSSTLGIKVGVSIGLFYSFGQAVNGSLLLTALGESICKMFKINDNLTKYMSRLIGCTIFLIILGNCFKNKFRNQFEFN
jgi:hypothetical protein